MRTNALEPDEYQQAQINKEFRKQSLYCIVSLVIFIIAFVTSDPNVAAMIPGSYITLLFIDIAIIVSVILLCKYQQS